MEDDLCLDRDMVKRSVHHGRIRKEGCLFVLSYALMVFEWEIILQKGCVTQLMREILFGIKQFFIMWNYKNYDVLVRDKKGKFFESSEQRQKIDQ